MKIVALQCVLLLTMLSCTSTGKNSDTAADSTKKETMTGTTNMGKFDLANLSFSENIDDLLKGQALTVADGSNTESTVMGYESFASSSPKLLVYNGQALSGGSGDKKNQLVLHYAQSGHQLNMYEAQIYSAEQTDLLEKNLLKKLGKPAFIKDSGLNKSTIRLDENGDEDKGPREDTKYQVWEDKATGISYFFIEKKLDGKIVYGELTAINTKSKNAAVWIKFRAFDWYKS